MQFRYRRWQWAVRLMGSICLNYSETDITHYSVASDKQLSSKSTTTDTLSIEKIRAARINGCRCCCVIALARLPNCIHSCDCEPPRSLAMLPFLFHYCINCAQCTVWRRGRCCRCQLLPYIFHDIMTYAACAFETIWLSIACHTTQSPTAEKLPLSLATHSIKHSHTRTDIGIGVRACLNWCSRCQPNMKHELIFFLYFLRPERELKRVKTNQTKYL